MSLNNSWTDTTTEPFTPTTSFQDFADITVTEDIPVGAGSMSLVGTVDNVSPSVVTCIFTCYIEGEQCGSRNVEVTGSTNNFVIDLTQDATEFISTDTTIVVRVAASGGGLIIDTGMVFTVIKDVPLQIHIGPWSKEGTQEEVTYLGEQVTYLGEDVVRTA